MKRPFTITLPLAAANTAVPITAIGVMIVLSVAAQLAEPGWLRTFAGGKGKLTVYHPHSEYWNGYTNFHFRRAIRVTGVIKPEGVSVAEVDAVTVTTRHPRSFAGGRPL